MPTFSFRLLLAALLLITGCRSERLAFDFHSPTPLSAAVAPSVTQAPEPHPAEARATAAPPVAARRMNPDPVVAPHRSGLLPTLTLRPIHTETAARKSGFGRRQLTRRVANDKPEHRNLHIVLGALLIVGGVVGGILLGGWLGLGVGAAVVLGGYYFLGLAFGGKHGWREVFQEFFNM